MTDSGDFLNDTFQYSNEIEIRNDERQKIVAEIELAAKRLDVLNDTYIARVYRDLAQIIKTAV